MVVQWFKPAKKEEIFLVVNGYSIAYNFSLSRSHCSDMTEIHVLLKRTFKNRKLCVILPVHFDFYAPSFKEIVGWHSALGLLSCSPFVCTSAIHMVCFVIQDHLDCLSRHTLLDHYWLNITMLNHLDSILIQCCVHIGAQKEITSQTDQYLVILSSKSYVFEDRMTQY